MSSFKRALKTHAFLTAVLSKTIWARKFVTSLSQCNLPSFAGKFLMIIATNQHREQHGHKLSKKTKLGSLWLSFAFRNMRRGLLHAYKIKISFNSHFAYKFVLCF